MARTPVVKYGKRVYQDPDQDPTNGIGEMFYIWCDYPAAKTSNWFRKMPKRIPDERRPAKIVADNIRQGFKERLGLVNTSIKTCPGIKDLLVQTLVVKAPCDIDVLRVTPEEVGLKDGRPENILLAVPASEYIVFQEGHTQSQFTHDADPTFKDHLNLKLDSRLSLICPKDVDVTFMQPLFHNPNAPWKIIPGTFKFPQNKLVGLLLNAFVPSKIKSFRINYGDALFYAMFSKPVKVEPLKEKNGIVRNVMRSKKFWGVREPIVKGE